MEAPLDELYLTWLYQQVGDSQATNRRRTYWRLLRLMYLKEFVWFVPHDDNRIEDGRDLRYEFVDDLELTDVDTDWVQLGCSFLELTIALSRRLAFEAEGEPRTWFWKLIDNLGLDKFNDAARFSDEKVNDILDRVIWRQYSKDGKGGFFPLAAAEKDQTEVEIWYQLCAYVLERM